MLKLFFSLENNLRSDQKSLHQKRVLNFHGLFISLKSLLPLTPMIFFILWIAIVLNGAFAQGSYPEHFRFQVLTTDSTSSTVNERSFNSIPSLVYALHLKELQAQGRTVEIKTDWQKPYFTAWAHQESATHYSLNFWGGLARIPGMNDEGHALTACHELGHVIGGKPKIKIKQFLWSSAEGQSDYFATGVCLKRYFSYMYKLKKLSIPEDIPEVSFTLCRTTYEKEEDFLICLNSSKAINAFRKVLIHLGQYQKTIEIDTPSRQVVKATMFDSYPEEQCRIDTLFQGSLCSEKDFPCDKKQIGARPVCWYRD